MTNKFVLELSGEGGGWTTPTILNTLDEFYTPVVNGTLPATLALGNYKLRIRSTQPEIIVESGFFSVIATTNLPTFPTFKSNISNGSSSFNCLVECSSVNNIFGQLQAAYGAITNFSEAQRTCTICNFNVLTSSCFATLVSIQNSSVINLNITEDGEFVIPNDLTIGTYVIEIESKNSLGVSSVYSNIFIFQGSGTGFGNASGEKVCVGSRVDFAIDLNPSSGIGRNYLGSKYSVNFGDETELWFTQAQIIANPAISHIFNAASCGSNSGSQSGYSKVTFSLYNKGVFSILNSDYCTKYLLNGSGATKNVNISKAPIADFTNSAKQCIDIPIVATNKTLVGSYGTDVCFTKPVCEWSYKKPSSSTFKLATTSWVSESGNLTIPQSVITEPGCWELKLITYNPDGCNTPTEKVNSIQIEATPIPTFTMSPVSPICASTSIKFTNATNVISLACQDPAYSWTVAPDINTPATSGGVEYINGSSATSLDAEMKFTQPGTYQVSLNVTNSCGTIVSSTPTPIEVYGDPTVLTSSDLMIDCTANTGVSATPANYMLDMGTVSIKPIYSGSPYAPASYEWTVTGDGVSAADYSYTGGTDASSSFPKIKFTAFKTYTLKVKVNGNCTGSNEKTVTFTLNEIPVMTNPSADLSQLICSGTATAALNLISSMSATTFKWTAVTTMGTSTLSPSSGAGTTISATVFDNTSTTDGTVTYTITPMNNGCSGESKELVVTVHPKITVHPFVPISLCNNSPYTAEAFYSDVTTATFTWINDNPDIGLSVSGTGNLPPFTPVNAGIDPIVANVTVTPKNSSCFGEPFTFEIYVNPTPIVENITSLVKCNGDPLGNISFTGTVLDTKYIWTNDNPTIGIPATGENNIISRALTNITTTVQVATITVTPTFTYKGTTCSGTPKTFTITVNPTAEVRQPVPQIVCTGGNASAITFASSNTGGATTYNWTNSASSIGLAATGSGDIPAFAVINTGNAPKTATITVIPTFTNAGVSCTGTAKNFSITANPTPSLQSISPKNICNGVTTAAIAFDTPVGGTVCTWTNSNPGIGLTASGTGNIPTFTATNFSADPITAIITVTPKANGCEGTMQSFGITVNPTIKTVLSSPAQTICSGDSTMAVTLSSASSAVSYDWQVLPSLGVVVAEQSGRTNIIPIQTLVNTTATPINVVYEATATLTDGTGCVGQKSIHTITVNPKAAIGPMNDTICSGGTFSVTPIDGGGNIIPIGTTYSWSAPTISTSGAIAGGTAQSAGQSSIGGTLTNLTTTNATATYSVTPTSGSCVGVPLDVVVTVNPTPTVNSVGNWVFCAGETSSQIDFTGGVAGSTFDWACDNASIGILLSGTDKVPAFTTVNNSNASIIATITVIPKANGCVGTYKQFTITVHPRPAITTLLGNVTLCNNTPFKSIALAANVAGTTFEWTNDASDIGLAATGSGVISDFTAVNGGLLPLIATVKVTPKANGCVGTSKSFTITVNPTPTVNAVSGQELCAGFPTTKVDFTGNIGSTTYHWKNNNTSIGLAASGSGAIPSFMAINTGSTLVTATITVTPSFNGCDGSAIIYSIRVIPTPAFTMQPVSNSICKDGVLPPLSVAFKNGTGTASYQWYSNADSNTTTGTPISGENSTTYDPSSNNVGTKYYYCQVTFSSGVCAPLVSTAASITINALPTVSLDPLSTQRLCVGGTIPTSLQVGYQDGVGVDSYQWYSSSSTDTSHGTSIDGATASTYTPHVFTVPGKYYYFAVVTLDGIGCGYTKSAAAEIVVVADPIVTNQPIASQTLCQGATAESLKVQVSGGIGEYAYQWYKSETNSTNGIAIPTATEVTYQPSTATVGILFYYCMVTQPNGLACNVTSDFAEVKVNLPPTISTQPPSSTICKDEVPKQLAVKVVNGVGTPTYQWYSNATNDILGSGIDGATSATYNPPYAVAGTVYYYCIITYPTGGCSVLTSNTATVTIHQYPVISPVDKLIGSGTSFFVSPVDNINGDIVPDGTTYTWSAPVVFPANAVTGASAQSVGQKSISQLLDNVTRSTAKVTYTVTPSNAGCAGTNFEITVEARPPLNPNAKVKNISCFGEEDGSITTAIEGGNSPYTVLWTGPNEFTSPDASISGLAQGDYALTITDDISLPFTQTYTIIEPREIKLTTVVDKNVSCFGAANGAIDISVTGGTGAYKYTWTKDNVAFATVEDLTNLSPGKYVVTVTDLNNCRPKTLSFTITEPALLKINLISQTNVLCYGDTTGAASIAVQGGTKFEVTPGVFDYKYSWTGPNGFKSTNQNLAQVIAGDYNLTLIDKQGCQQTLAVTITQQAEIIIKATASPITCYGANNATIRLDITGGVPPYQTEWNNLATGGALDNLAAGDYIVTVIDALSCSRSIHVNIPEAPVFKISPVVKQISCYGAHDGSITLNYKGDSKLSKLVWSDGATSGTTRNNLGPGTYTVTINDGSPCIISETYVIVEPKPLVLAANLTHALSCTNAKSGAIDLTVSGGTLPYKYVWSNGAATEDLANITSGNYLVTVTDVNGCMQQAQYTITRPAPINIVVVEVPEFDCDSKVNSKILTAKVTGGVPPYTLSWSSGAVTGTNNEVMKTAQNSLVLIDVVDALGCSANQSYNVVILPVGIKYQLIDCNARSYQFNVLVPLDKETYTFYWDFGDGVKSTSRNPMHSFTTAGNHTVKLKYSSPTCTSTLSDVIIVEGAPVLSLDRLPIMCNGDSMVIRATGATTYRWNDGSLADSTLIKRAGDYTVIGYSKAGCTDTLKFKVTYYDLFKYTIQTDKVETSSDESPMHIWTEPIPFSQYYWDFGDGHTAEGIDQNHAYDRSQVGPFDIKLRIMNPNGCVEYATKRIWVLNKSTVNTFSPNNDGINDVFMKSWHLQIFNRNGLMLHEGNDGWDGTYNGKVVNNGTYFYVLYYDSEAGTKTKTGYVTVMW